MIYFVLTLCLLVLGQWKDWGAWSACSKSCGLGKSTRVRACDGAKCNGQQPTEASSCKLQDCIGKLLFTFTLFCPTYTVRSIKL